MDILYINSFVKLLGMNLCIVYCFFKILNYKDINDFKKISIILITILMSTTGCVLKNQLHPLLITIIVYLIENLILSFLLNIRYGYSLFVLVISISIDYIIYTLEIR